MRRLRLQLIGILALVALLPALPAAWMTHALIERVLQPVLTAEIQAGAQAGLASTRDLLSAQRAELIARYESAGALEVLSADQFAALTPRDRSTLEALAAEAPAPDPHGPPVQILRPPRRIELGGRTVWLTRLTQAGAAQWAVAPLAPELAQRAARIADSIRLIESLRREREAIVRGLVMNFIAGYGAILALVLLVGLYLASRLTRPLAALGRGIEAVAGGDLETRLPAGGRGAIERLLGNFNDMVGRLRSQQAELRRLEKTAAWRQMARNLAHEIKNPLTPIQLAAQQTRDAYRGDDPEYAALLAESTGIIEEEVRALRNLVTTFSQFARLPEPQRAPIALAEILGDVTSLYGSDRVRTHMTDPAVAQPAARPELQVDCDREQIHRVLVNLINNALQAQEALGRRDPIEIGIALPPAAGGAPAKETVGREPAARADPRVRITIADRGPGVPLEERQRVLEPGYTTRAEGMGLGLAIAAAALEAHGSTIEIAERPGGGARVTFTLPLSALPPTGGSRPAPETVTA